MSQGGIYQVGVHYLFIYLCVCLVLQWPSANCCHSDRQKADGVYRGLFIPAVKTQNYSMTAQSRHGDAAAPAQCGHIVTFIKVTCLVMPLFYFIFIFWLQLCGLSGQYQLSVCAVLLLQHHDW